MIRPVEMKDAEPLLALLKEVDQSNVMRYSPGERKMTIDIQFALIEETIQQSRRAIFVYEQQGELIGYCMCQAEPYARTKHIGEIVIGVSEKLRQQHVAKQLMETAEAWAKDVGIHRLQCAVFERNEAARQFLQTSGFLEEGKRVDALYVDGRYYDEISYYKLI